MLRLAHQVARPPLRRWLLPLVVAGPALGLALGLAAPALRSRPAWPGVPLRLLVAAAPGGAADRIARLLQPRLAGFLGQPVLVENRAGGGGLLALQALAAAPPDGATLLLEDSSLLVPALLQRGGEPAPVQLTGLGAVAETPMLLAVPAASGITDVAGLLGMARMAQAPLPYGSAGLGSLGHVAGALLAARQGLALEHVPYRGGGGIQRDLATGRLAAGFLGSASLGPMVAAGRIRAVASSHPGGPGWLGALPGFAGIGLQGIEALGWHGIFTAAAAPRDLRLTLTAALGAATADPELGRILRGFGARPLQPDAGGFSRRLAEAEAALRGLVREAGLAPRA
ncbi:tripartite tricarboxylate transporter substrate binding protein [Roseomonas sp. USHLN139]|uniref:tripartite tricarboxylate transporter substrate binding protein n=1 Tax=Roseomonas sp. USHLN139 TaxID=3081298 RepID=UPI003B01D6BA